MSYSCLDAYENDFMRNKKRKTSLSSYFVHFLVHLTKTPGMETACHETLPRAPVRGKPGVVDAAIGRSSAGSRRRRCARVA